MKSFRKQILRFIPFIILLMITGLLLSRVFRPEPSVREPAVRITSFEASEYIGKTAEVCGTVISAHFHPEIGGQPIFLNFDRPYPEQTFTAVIWNEDRFRWTLPPEQSYKERFICVSGKIQKHRGKPQIRLRSPEQVRL